MLPIETSIPFTPPLKENPLGKILPSSFLTPPPPPKSTPIVLNKHKRTPSHEVRPTYMSPHYKLTLNTRIHEISYALFELMIAALASASTGCLSYGAYFFGRLAVAMLLNGGIFGIISGGLSIGLFISAYKCGQIAHREFQNGSKDLSANIKGLIRSWIAS